MSIERPGEGVSRSRRSLPENRFCTVVYLESEKTVGVQSSLRPSLYRVTVLGRPGWFLAQVMLGLESPVRFA